MKRACVCLVTFAGVMIATAAGPSGLPEPPHSPGFDDRSSKASRLKSEPLPVAEIGPWGTFQGRVIFKGDPPTPRVIADPELRSIAKDHHNEIIPGAPLQRLRDYEVMAKRGAPIRSEQLLVDPETKGVRNALVYLVKPTAVRDVARKAVPKTLRFRADRGVFEPHVLAAMQGSEILITTEDPIAYHVDIRNPGAEFVVTWTAQASKKVMVSSNFDRLNFVLNGGRGELPASPLQVRPTAGAAIPMKVVNSIQNWMSAWWLVLDHPYFAVTDDRGNFTIRNVPIGPQQVVVWHESVDPRGTREWVKSENVFQGEVVIRNGSPTVKEFVIERGQLRFE